MNELNDCDENIIHCTGSLSILEPLVVDKSYRVGLEIECFSKEKRSLQNGKYQLHFKGRIVAGEVLKDNGEVIKSKSKDSPSNKQRKAILSLGCDYDLTMALLLANLEEVLQDLKNQ